MRCLSLSLTASFVLWGCLSIGSRQLQSPTSAEPKTEDSRALLIIVDGLNHDALKTYLKTLLDADHEPRWQSGLSLLARERFRLANAQYPMASIPTFTTTAEATLATGQPPNQHGLIGT
ncbi:MAG: alkaline phosphatase family protein, partial [Bradymonadia bacterium]